MRDADELHDCLLSLGALPAAEGADWKRWFEELAAEGRATRLQRDSREDLWVAAERWSLVKAAFPEASCQPALVLPAELVAEHEPSEAYQALVRGRLEACGPVTSGQIATTLGLRTSAVDAALEAIEATGSVLRGRYTTTDGEIEWCDRRLLARIHRLTLDGARRRIQPAEPADFWRFLLAHQHATPETRLDGRAALFEIVSQLQGFEAPAGAWERDLLPGRLADYDTKWLDDLSHAGEIAWGRLAPKQSGMRNAERGMRSEEESEELKSLQLPTSDLRLPTSASLTRIVPICLVARTDLPWLLPPERGQAENFARSNAKIVYETLVSEGASFFHDLTAMTGLLPAQLEEALSELAALGLATADGFATIRSLVALDQRHATGGRNRRRAGAARQRYSRGGRWSKFPPRLPAVEASERAEAWARQLLRRYGVMFRDLLARERSSGMARAGGRLSPLGGPRQDSRRAFRVGRGRRAIRSA